MEKVIESVSRAQKPLGLCIVAVASVFLPAIICHTVSNAIAYTQNDDPILPFHFTGVYTHSKSLTPIISSTKLQIPRNYRKHRFPLVCRGVGSTEYYSWKETDDGLEVKFRLGKFVPSDFISSKLHPKSILIECKGQVLPLIDGKLKGVVSPSDSYWWIDRGESVNTLSLWLQKAKHNLKEWMGLIEGERIVDLAYDELAGKADALTTPSGVRLPNQILLNYPLNGVTAESCREWLMQWCYASHYGNDLPSSMGIPKTQLRITPFDLPGGVRLVLEGPHNATWDAEDWIDIQIVEDPGQLHLIARRGGTASGLQNQFGSLIQMQVQDAEDRLIRKLQQDLGKSHPSLREFELSSEAMKFHDSGNQKMFNTRFGNSGEEMIPAEKKMREASDFIAPTFLSHSKDSEGELDIHIDLESNETKAAPSFMKEWSLERKKDYRRELVWDFTKNFKMSQQPRFYIKFEDIVGELQKHTGSNDTEMKNIWNIGKERYEKYENSNHFELLKENQLQRQMRNTQSEMSFNNQQMLKQFQLMEFDYDSQAFVIPSKEEPLHINATERPLFELYSLLDKSGKENLRRLWKAEFDSLVSLIAELSCLKDEEFPYICDKYRGLLLSNKYTILLKEYLTLYPITTENAKRTLRLLNQFVISLYEDIEVLMNYNAKQQLRKISLLCQQAIIDDSKLTEYAESMKHLFDSDFLSFLVHSVTAERAKITKAGRNPDVEPSDWLMLLMIIKQGVMSLFEKEVSEDGLWLSILVTQQQPEVRETLLKILVANLPKADWKQFKSVAKSMAAAVKKSPSKYSSLGYPWLVSAVLQMERDIERVLPDWMIEGLLSDDDRLAMKKTSATRSILWQGEALEKLLNISSQEEVAKETVLKLLKNQELIHHLKKQ